MEIVLCIGSTHYLYCNTFNWFYWCTNSKTIPNFSIIFIVPACSDPSVLLANRSQQFKSGQSLVLPANTYVTYLIECTGNKIYSDGSIEKTISCTNKTWAPIPNGMCTRMRSRDPSSIQCTFFIYVLIEFNPSAFRNEAFMQESKPDIF